MSTFSADRAHIEPSDGDDDKIEQKFQSTYDEVIALKKLLQEMLHVGERAEAPDSPSTSNSSNDEYAELPADQAEYASGSEPSMPGKMMCFSDEMCSFTPEILERPPLKNRERAFQPTIRAPIARANHESMHEGEEEAAIMNRPRASKSSVELLRRSATFEPNFQARMRQSLVQNRRKKEQIRLSVCEKEAECIKATPTINRRSKRISRNVSHLMAWNYEKENKLSHLRHEEAAKQEAEMIGKPAIARRSTVLFEKREDEIAHCKVEDRLHLLGLIYQYQQEERLIEQAKAAGSFHPNVAPHSANLTRKHPLSAHERLYQLSKRKAKREMGSDNRISHDTKPRETRKNNREEEALPAAVRRLWSIGEEYKKRRQQQVDHQNLQVDRLLNTPKLTGRSRKIASQRRKSASQSNHNRRCWCCRRKDAFGDHDSSKCKPPCRVDSTQANAIYQKQVRWKQEKEEKHSQLKDFYNELAQSECTFKNPYYKEAWNTLSLQSPKSCHSDDATQDPSHRARDELRNPNTAFFERTMKWATKKEQRLEQEKQVWREIQLSECTFKPKVSPLKRSSCTKTWSPGKGMIVSGVGSYRGSPFSKRSIPASPQIHPARFLTTFVLPEEYGALDLEALAATPSEHAHSPQSGCREQESPGRKVYPMTSTSDCTHFTGR